MKEEDKRELRRKAEEALKGRPGEPEELSLKDSRDLIHELQVHQIELEMQNEELCRAQEELVESRDRYSDLYDFAPVGYLTLDEHGVIQEANLTAALLLGEDRGNLIGMPLSMSVPEEDRKEFYAYFNQSRQGGGKHITDLRLLGKAGTIFHSSLTSTPAEEGGLHLAFSDITERKIVETRYEEASEIGHIGHWERDLETDEATWTEETYRINGVDSANFEPTSENLMEIIHPDDREIIKDVLENSSPGRKINYDYRIIKPDGTLRYVYSQAEVVEKPGGGMKAVGVIQDITERRMAEMEVMESREKFRKLVEGSIQGIFILQEDQVIYANPAVTELFGFPVEEIASHPIENFKMYFHPEDRERIWKTFTRIIEGKPYPTRMDFRVIRMDGETVWLEAGAHLIENEGRPALQVFFVDVTARKTEEEMITHYTRQLEEANRLKDLFGDVLRHDIANPLNVIGLYTELLMEEDKDPERSAKLGIIKDALADATELVNQAATLSRIESMDKLEVQELDLSDIVEETVARHQIMAKEAGLEIVDRVPPGTTVKANPVIKEVFSNLISNAVKYAPDGKKVILEGRSANGMVRVDVIDFGPGIKDEDKEGIFARYERREKEGVKGWGLGLAITTRIVEMHQGRIWAQDNPEGGSTFCVELPEHITKKAEPVKH